MRSVLALPDAAASATRGLRRRSASVQIAADRSAGVRAAHEHDHVGHRERRRRTLPSKVEVKPTPKPKGPTRAQLLAKALAKCRKQFKHNSHKKATCEKQARKKYGHSAKKAKRAKKASRRHRRGR